MSTTVHKSEIFNQKKKLAASPEELTQYTCSILGGRRTNEDYESINKTIFKKIGTCLHYGVYDGHAGDDISKLLKKSFHNIFVSIINDLISSSEHSTEEIIIKAFQLTNLKLVEIVEKLWSQNGSTIITLYYFKDLKKAFVFNLGDGRFICYNNKTGKIKKNLVKTIDLEDNFESEYKFGTEEGKNSLHYFPCSPKLKTGCTNLSISKPYQKGDIQKNYYFEHEKNDFLLREWELLLLNKKSNPNGNFKNIKKQKDASFRYNGLQPSRSLETDSKGRCLSLGMIHILDIPEEKNVGFFIGCDGFEDGKALNVIEICDFLSQPKIDSKKILSSNLIQYIKNPYWQLEAQKYLLGTMKPKELTSDMTDVEIITWIKKNFCGNYTVNLSIPYDWKRGFCTAISHFFEKIDQGKIKFSDGKIEDLAHYAILCGSSDNVSGICAEFHTICKKKKRVDDI